MWPTGFQSAAILLYGQVSAILFDLVAINLRLMPVFTITRFAPREEFVGNDVSSIMGELRTGAFKVGKVFAYVCFVFSQFFGERLEEIINDL